MRRPHALLTLTLVALATAAACGGNPEITTKPGSGGAGGSGAQGGNGNGGDIFTTSAGGTGGMGDPCDGVPCPDDQHCELDGEGMPVCVNNDCMDLVCLPTEECQPTPGGGAICVDIGCSDDVDCLPSEHCNGTICVDDVCIPGNTTCTGADLYECLSNGSASVLKYTCGSPAYFQSDCIDDMMGGAYCGCEDDWDCPANTFCEGGQCTGSGQPPTCFLPPEPFTNVLPTPEIVWGGTQANKNAIGSPFEPSAQVVQAPVVANLDDDNGDGLINDLDFPEIIFTSFCNSDFTSNGILRAIHGGGMNKGGDFFANCGGTAWKEGDALPISCNCASASLDSTASLAVGDLDNDGVPEIVAIGEGDQIHIYSNTGDLISVSAGQSLNGANPGPAIANLDMAGFAEIVIGRHVFTLEKDMNGALQILDLFEGNLNSGTNGQGPVSCVANISGDARPEIVAGTTAYRMPTPPAGVTQQSQCTGMETLPEEVAYCGGDLVVVWDGNQVNGGAVPTSNDEGFCAIADVLGVDQTLAPSPANPLDDLPEVIVVANGNVYIFNGQDGTLRRDLNPGEGIRGGPPNVDDFDGDGFPEFGTAYSTAYVVFDLQDPTAECPAWTASPSSDGASCASVNPPRTPPGVACNTDNDCSSVTPGTVCNEQTNQCVCLHNSWRRATEDDSSRVTGSSVFDFNGDGAAEVIYNDECRFRIYDGLDCSVYMNEPSESRTRIEYPIVVDVDNDGNAEIVFSTTNESGFCSENLDSQYNNGIEVWGDASDFWVSARRVWNQHPYNVTNITEAGRVPMHAPEHWLQYEGREYNIFRSNPRTLGIAPDLLVEAVQVSSPGGGCGMLSTDLVITAEIKNQGDLRVGPGVVIGFEGFWNAGAVTEPLYADMMMTPLTFVLQTSLEPGQSIFISVSYDALNNSPMTVPDEITVIADQGDVARECDEANNELTIPVLAGAMEPDLRVELGSASQNPICPTVPTTVFNDGSAAANDVVVRYYAGNPAQGGTALHDETVPMPVPAGGQVSFDASIPNFPQGLQITIHAIVDPDDLIAECNDGNNGDAADGPIQCGGIN